MPAVLIAASGVAAGHGGAPGAPSLPAAVGTAGTTAATATSAAAAAASQSSVTVPRDGIVIAVVGDPGVGKTTFISTLVSAAAPAASSVPSVLEPVVIPAEFRDEQVAVTLLDTASAAPHTQLARIRAADAVLLLCSPDRPSSFLRVHSHWLPLIAAAAPATPVVVVVAKAAAAASLSPWTAMSSSDSPSTMALGSAPGISIMRSIILS